MLKYRKLFGFICILLTVLIWFSSSDVVELIVRQREVLFNRYSRGHFGVLFLLSLLLIGLAVLCFSKINSIKEILLTFFMISFSTLLSIFFIVLVSGWLAQPRYIEHVVDEEVAGVKVTGVIRHRPPNQTYELSNLDVPPAPRSYPNAPAGYPPVKIRLTVDKYGFRNSGLTKTYPIVAVGDSFVAGSHVSDEHAWVYRLSQGLNLPIYNLGVSGADPQTYLNNYVSLGQQFSPKVILFMIYEGNDFKKGLRASATSISTNGETEQGEDGKTLIEKPSLSKRIKTYTKASPVTTGLRRLSQTVFEKIAAQGPVKNYEAQVAWMPVSLRDAHGQTKHYAFTPRRMLYLYTSADQFKRSPGWQATSYVMRQMQHIATQQQAQIVFLYAPSTPHVIMPLIHEQVSAQQLRNFAATKTDNLPDAKTFKETFYANIDAQENTWRDFCTQNNMHCLSLTSMLQTAAQEGQQMYYTYDQHWTPEGNALVAKAVHTYLAQTGLPLSN